MLNKKLLYAFMNSFYGYGNLGADLWFIGMEEGGGRTEEEIKNRLSAWNARGRREIEDAYEFHRESGMGHLFEGTGQAQKTWAALIRTILSIQSVPASKKRIREYQNLNFGRSRGDAAYLELLPLPSPGSQTWNYGAGAGKPARRWSTLTYLQTRAEYEERFRTSRSIRLRHMIRYHQPKAVVFYGISNKAFAQEVCGASFLRPKNLERVEKTDYLLLGHPTQWGRGIQKIYFASGKKLRAIGVRC